METLIVAGIIGLFLILALISSIVVTDQKTSKIIMGNNTNALTP